MRLLILLASCFISLYSSAVLAQHDMHSMDNAGQDMVTTMPGNNEVLAAAPTEVMLHFEKPKTLVKLVVKDPAANFVDINFRFDPRPSQHFARALPALAPQDYYSVEWAILDDDGALVKGTFYFSFGADAKPPSFYLDQMEHEMHIMAPDYRLL